MRSSDDPGAAYDASEDENQGDHRETNLGKVLLVYTIGSQAEETAHMIHGLYAGKHRAWSSIIPPRKEERPAQSGELDSGFTSHGRGGRCDS